VTSLNCYGKGRERVLVPLEGQLNLSQTNIFFVKRIVL